MGHIKNISELLPDEPIKDPFEDEIHFNNTVREYVVFLVVLLLLSVASHVVVLRYRRREAAHLPPHRHADDDEAAVDRIATSSSYCNSLSESQSNENCLVKLCRILFPLNSWTVIETKIEKSLRKVR
ncbi:hypothetical protein Pcinc_022308 [Petrolisthes cinctipes]|uniref:Uncharacterized protein n=1 Tax=Petrolisthes cinctipes TaxID=88211 RepID=A0AAE1FED3_PETCI|nr:hypothetical protein Pcinc_022308 [Petrolisthes cinctipes]